MEGGCEGVKVEKEGILENSSTRCQHALYMLLILYDYTYHECVLFCRRVMVASMKASRLLLATKLHEMLSSFSKCSTLERIEKSWLWCVWDLSYAHMQCTCTCNIQNDMVACMYVYNYYDGVIIVELFVFPMQDGATPVSKYIEKTHTFKNIAA